MTKAEDSLPPLRIVAAALRKTTETLAQELAKPTDRAPDWNPFEWKMAKAVAAMHGVSPLLSDTLRWQGAGDWAAFLSQQKTHTARRYQRMVKLLGEIDCAARDVGVAILPLKGVALHAQGVYQAGERPMADIDLLVSDRDLDPTVKLLQVLGFRETYAVQRHRVLELAPAHAPARLGEHADNALKIELHTRISEGLPLREADISTLLWLSHPRAGLNGYRSTAALMIHLLLHAAGNMVVRGLRLLHLNDLAQLAGRMSDADWEYVAACRLGGRRLWWALPPLRLVGRYYLGLIPEYLPQALESDCPRLLRSIARDQLLCDVSYSQLWIEAFPGFEWSASWSELAAYVTKRIWPDETYLAERRLSVTTSPWASVSSWSQLSQTRRILRWVRSRPPRLEVMYAVHAALATPDVEVRYGC
jgi:Uncharacterised nucleotidyltransferase